MIASGDYFLQPSYQRRHRWSAQKKSALIESFVMNVPIPPVFLYEYEFSKYEVMDGLQRLSTINEFYNGQFELDGLVQWPELNGRRYETLPDSVRAGVDRRYLSSIILLQETAKSPGEADALKQLVFERINSGGEKLTPQESRNAIFPGSMNSLCLELSRRESLCLTWDIPAPSEFELLTGEPDESLLENSSYREMADVELVLRFFAFRQDVMNLHGALRDYFDNYQRVPRIPLIRCYYSDCGSYSSKRLTSHMSCLGSGPSGCGEYETRNGTGWHDRPLLLMTRSCPCSVSISISGRNSLP